MRRSRPRIPGVLNPIHLQKPGLSELRLASTLRLSLFIAGKVGFSSLIAGYIILIAVPAVPHVSKRVTHAQFVR